MDRQLLDSIIFLITIATLFISSMYLPLTTSIAISLFISGGYLLTLGLAKFVKSYVVSAPSYYIMWGGILIDIAIVFLLTTYALDLSIIVSIFLLLLVPLIILAYRVRTRAN